MDRINGNESKSQILIEIFVCRDISASPLEAHLHIEFAAFTHSSDINIFVEDLHVAISLDHSGGDDAGFDSTKVNRLRIFAVELEWNLLQIKDDVGGIFNYARDRLELVKHALNFYRGDSRSFDG